LKSVLTISSKNISNRKSYSSDYKAAYPCEYNDRQYSHYGSPASSYCQLINEVLTWGKGTSSPNRGSKTTRPTWGSARRPHPPAQGKPSPQYRQLVGEDFSLVTTFDGLN
jgi:hypothetical protein